MIPSILGTGNCPSALSPRNFALLAVTPNQHGHTNRQYRRLRIGAAQQELSRTNGEGVVAPGYAAYRSLIVFADTAPPCFPTGLTFVTRTTTVCGGLGKSARVQRWMGHFWFNFRMTQTNRASSFSGAPRDFNGSCTRLLGSTSAPD